MNEAQELSETDTVSCNRKYTRLKLINYFVYLEVQHSGSLLLLYDDKFLSIIIRN